MAGRIKIDGRVLVPAAPATASVDQTSGTKVNANADRLAIVLSNAGSAKIYLAFGSNAAVANRGVMLAAGASFTMSERVTGAIQAICATGETSTLAIQEFN